MKRVIGIGGVFFKAKDPEKLRAWYQKYLGLEPDACTLVCRTGIPACPLVTQTVSLRTFVPLQP